MPPGVRNRAQARPGAGKLCLCIGERTMTQTATSSIKNPRPSSVSRVLTALRDEVLLTPGRNQAVEHDGFRFQVAGSRAVRERAYRLACAVYRNSGYIKDGREWIAMPQDLKPETFTLLAEDLQGRPAATISLIFDSELGLPCDQLYADEVAALRLPGRKLGEVVRLAIAEEFQHSKHLFLRMINLSFIFGLHVRGATDCLIEVNPRHTAFYQRLMGFKQLGAERPCPRVAGAIGVLLHLKMSDYAEAMEARRAGLPLGEREIFGRFLPPETEARTARLLSRQHRPMTQAEARHFGLQTEAEPLHCSEQAATA